MENYDPIKSLSLPFYEFWRQFNLFTLWTFFDQKVILHKERIPSSGPVLFCSNHVNAVVDAQVILTSIPRSVHFLAKQSILQIPILGKAAQLCGTVPVLRKEDSHDGGKRDHASMFTAVFRALTDDKAVAIFPEGLSHDEPYIQQLKPGIVLIVAGAYKQGIKVPIIPVGLSFTQKESFRSSYVVKYGEPFMLPDELLSDVNESQQLGKHSDALNSCLSIIHIKMHNVIEHAKDSQQYKQANTILSLLQTKYHRIPLAERFEILRDICLWLQSENSEKETEFLKKINKFQEILLQSQLDIEFLMESPSLTNCFYSAISLIVLVLLWLPGVILNSLALLVTNFATNTAVKSYSIGDVKKGLQKPGYKALDVISSLRIFSMFFCVPVSYTLLSFLIPLYFHTEMNIFLAFITTFTSIIIFSVFSITTSTSVLQYYKYLNNFFQYHFSVNQKLVTELRSSIQQLHQEIFQINWENYSSIKGFMKQLQQDKKNL